MCPSSGNGTCEASFPPALPVRNKRNLRCCMVSQNKAPEMLQESQKQQDEDENRYQPALLLFHCQLHGNVKLPVDLHVINY